MNIHSIEEDILFKRIYYEDIDEFIKFLKEVKPEYPYRWFFDPTWIAEKVSDNNYIWGILKKRENIIGTVICYFDPVKVISVLKLLLIHPLYRRRGILNNIFFERLQEKRIVDEIQSHAPSQLFAEIVVNHQTSQKMIERIGMVFCGFYPNKTINEGLRTGLVPCALLFKKDKLSVEIDDRIRNKVETILRNNRVYRFRNVKTGIDKQIYDKDLKFTFKENYYSDMSGNQVYSVEVGENSSLDFQYNTYLKNISEARINSDDPAVFQSVLKYLQKFDANYMEIMIPPNLWMQDILIENDFVFTAYLPYYWAGDDILVFSTWKNRPVLTPKLKPIYNSIMEANLIV